MFVALFPCHLKTQNDDVFLASSVSGPFIAPTLVFLWCLGELIWLIKAAYYCVFLYCDCFLLLGLLFFTLMSCIGSLQVQISARADSRGGLRGE